MSDVVLKAEGLCKQFFRKGRESARYFDAVSKVDLQLRAGELVALVGRSGSGKSTLVNMLAGLLDPTDGRVSVMETNLYSLDDVQLSEFRNKTIGVVPQGQTALHSLSVVENVTLPYLMHHADDGAERRALDLLERVGIAHLADAYPRELSGGELRRMAIARSLICSPAVLFADEPTGDLDDENTRNVLTTLREMADAGTAVLVVTHERAVEGYADRFLHMDSGKCIEIGQSVFD
jgi:putative ABC transport system ATP-binding protein